MSLNELIQEYQKLSSAEQVRFHRLVGLFDDDSEITPDQSKTLDRRIEEYESGKVALLDGETALKEIADKHGLSLPISS